MKTKSLRCKHCHKKDTLVDISVSPVKINAFMYRGYHGRQCSECGHWNDKEYIFKDVEEGKG